jgi:hypothetical protein
MSTFGIDRAKLEIAARNRLRHESGLPALSVAVEARRMWETQRQREWNEYLQSNSRLLDRALQMAVARYRRRCGLPSTWRPGYCVGMGIGTRVLDAMRRRYRRASVARA